MDKSEKGEREYVRRVLSSEIVAAWVLLGETAIKRTSEVMCGWAAELDRGRELGCSVDSSGIEWIVDPVETRTWLDEEASARGGSG